MGKPTQGRPGADDPDPVFDFGKHRGRRVSEVGKSDSQYLKWAAKNVDDGVMSPNLREAIGRFLNVRKKRLGTMPALPYSTSERDQIGQNLHALATSLDELATDLAGREPDIERCKLMAEASAKLLRQVAVHACGEPLPEMLEKVSLRMVQVRTKNPLMI